MTNKSKTSKKENKSGVKFPSDFIKYRLNNSIIDCEYPYVDGDDKKVLKFKIINTLPTDKMPSFVEYCILASNINGEYKDYLFETNFRVAVLMQFTNLDIISLAQNLNSLIQGEDSLFWFVWYRLDSDLRDIVKTASNNRRMEECEKIKESYSPLSQIALAFKDQIKEYSQSASEILKEEYNKLVESDFNNTENVKAEEAGEKQRETL